MLSIRPQDITLDPDGVPVEFVSRQFLGHDDRLRLRLPHTGQFIHARLSHSGPLKAGQMLRIGVVPDRYYTYCRLTQALSYRRLDGGAKRTPFLTVPCQMIGSR